MFHNIFTHIIKKIFNIYQPNLHSLVGPRANCWMKSGMGAVPGSACGTRSSAETVHGTHVLDPAQNIIKNVHY
jgi:hypothetical protein